MLHLLVSAAAARPLVAVVVIDQEAREEGYALELEDLVVDDALPLEVAAGEHLAVLTPTGERQDLDVEPGEAWEISGRNGEAWMSRLGEEIRTDVLLVRGEEGAVIALARALDAQLQREGDGWLLVRPDVLFDAPWAEVADRGGLEEVQLVRVSPPPTRAEPSRAPTVAAVLAPAAPVAAPPRAAPAVPVPPTPAPVNDAQADHAEDVGDPAQPAVDRPAAARLDEGPYVGLYLCGDGTPLVLDGYGAFASAGARGEWYVSAPGVVRLVVEGRVWRRAAVEADRHYCRAVWSAPAQG